MRDKIETDLEKLAERVEQLEQRWQKVLLYSGAAGLAIAILVGLTWKDIPRRALDALTEEGILNTIRNFETEARASRDAASSASSEALSYRDQANSAFTEIQRLRAASKAIPVVVGEVQQNVSPQLLLVVGYCNSTRDSKDIEGKIGATRDSLEFAATESGGERGSITFLVPPKWHYLVTRTAVADIGCKFEGWPL